MEQLITVVVTMVGCTAFWQLLDHVLEARRKSKFDIESAVKDIQKDVATMQRNQASMQCSIDSLSDIVAENEVVNKRVRILQSADDVMRGVQRSKDRCDQDLSDIDGYERYCETHPNFRNNQTEMSINLIRHQYEYDLAHGTFLTYKSR